MDKLYDRELISLYKKLIITGVVVAAIPVTCALWFQLTSVVSMIVVGFICAVGGGLSGSAATNIGIIRYGFKRTGAAIALITASILMSLFFVF